METPAATTPAPTTEGTGDAQMVANANVVLGSEMEGTVEQLIAMGFERENVIRCLRAAFNNPDRAVDYLMSGIPDSVLAAIAEPRGAAAPPAAGGENVPMEEDSTPRNNTPAGVQAFPALPTGDAPMADAGDDAELSEQDREQIAALRNHPRFMDAARLIAQRPESIHQILG